MRKDGSNRDERPPRGHPEPVITLLAAAGLRAERVARCPEPTCPICSDGRRAAA